jgi:hypothetical protein
MLVTNKSRYRLEWDLFFSAFNCRLSEPAKNDFKRTAMILIIQGIYYILTGLWPLLHLHSFMLVTGEKTDTWLVKMVALLSVAIGLTLVYRPVSTQRLLAIGTAVSFAAIDIFYAAKGIISDVYFADAFIQIIFIVLIVIKKWKVADQ